MLTLSEIEKSYPDNLKAFKPFILREYLQHKILQIVFESEYSSQLSFLGGTCLRIVHNNSRFSEDLDFDNLGIGEEKFENIAGYIQKKLAQEGYSVEMKTVYRGAYHCYIRFPKLLYAEGLSGHLEEKILIQLDTEPQHYAFTPERYILNRFDVFTQIFTTPLAILLAQKFYAILNRKRNKGRDFFDVVFILSKINSPDYGYLSQKANIINARQLKEKILERCSQIDMEMMAKDVQPFLFNSSDAKKVALFPDYIKQFNFK
ncbi:MAG: nucleotidyl transferase AbiEii/AbiGii toxin family protein [Bacteroidetes bacterium]|nr:nucleotidyl transferase AbiEii/AbiGii toxin family protein [Bacteroidota bacterium]